MKKDKSEIEAIKKKVNSIKSELLDIVRELESEGGIREASSLNTIIEKLEDWQHK